MARPLQHWAGIGRSRSGMSAKASSDTCSRLPGDSIPGTRASLSVLMGTPPYGGQSLPLDPRGKVLLLKTHENGAPTLVEMPSGKLLGSLEHDALCLGPDAQYWAKRDGAPTFGFSLYRRKDKSPVVT